MADSSTKRRLSLRSSTPEPKKKRNFLTSEQKQYIFQSWIDFRESQTAQTFSSRSQSNISSRKKKAKKPPHNDDFVTTSWRNREQRFLNVSKRTWQRVIQKGREKSEFHQNGRPRTLDDESELALADHIKQMVLKGHIITRNSIRVWSLEALRSSTKYQQANLKTKAQLVSKIGGDRWCQKFLQRHGIQINQNASALELPRAQKSQPENLVDFYRKCLIVHGEAQVHFEARRLFASGATLQGVRLDTAVEFPPPQVQQNKPSLHSAASSRDAIGEADWMPGLTLSEEDFFFH